MNIQSFLAKSTKYRALTVGVSSLIGSILNAWLGCIVPHNFIPAIVVQGVILGIAAIASFIVLYDTN
jgi:hypothetical protein